MTSSWSSLVGVVTFGNRGYLEVSFNDTYHLSEYSRRLQSIRFPNVNTNTSGGLAVMRTELFGNPTSGVRQACWPKIALLLTDGPSTFDRQRTVLGTTNTARKQSRLIIIWHQFHASYWMPISFDSLLSTVCAPSISKPIIAPKI